MGLNLPLGLQEYQRKKRLESECKVLTALLTSDFFMGWRDIWLRTRIWKNNVNVILDDLIKQKKIVRLGPYNVKQFYSRTFFGNTSPPYSLRTILKSIFVPLITNPSVLEIIREHPEFVKAIKEEPVRRDLRNKVSYLKRHYSNKNVERGFVEERLHIASWWSRATWSEVNLPESVGVNLLKIYIALGKLPRNIE